MNYGRSQGGDEVPIFKNDGDVQRIAKGIKHAERLMRQDAPDHRTASYTSSPASKIIVEVTGPKNEYDFYPARIKARNTQTTSPEWVDFGDDPRVMSQGLNKEELDVGKRYEGYAAGVLEFGSAEIEGFLLVMVSTWEGSIEAGSGGSGADNDCKGCFPTEGDGNDPYMTIDVVCSDGILYVLRGRTALVYDPTSGRIRIEYSDLVWDEEGCCECSGSEGSGLTTDCGTAPSLLNWTITNKSGNCVCAPTSGTAVYDVEHDDWVSVPFECALLECEENATYYLYCDGSNWRFAPGRGDTMPGGYTAASFTQSPFEIVFNVSPTFGGSYTITFTAP